MEWARVRDFGELQKKSKMSPIRAARKARALEVILSRYLKPKTIERFGLDNPYCSVDAKKVLLNMIRRKHLKGKDMDYSAAERERAESRVEDLRNGGEAYCDIALDLQMELNRAVDLLRDAPVTGRHEWSQRNADFLSHYPDASPETKGE